MPRSCVGCQMHPRKLVTTIALGLGNENLSKKPWLWPCTDRRKTTGARFVGSTGGAKQSGANKALTKGQFSNWSTVKSSSSTQGASGSMHWKSPEQRKSSSSKSPSTVHVQEQQLDRPKVNRRVEKTKGVHPRTTIIAMKYFVHQNHYHHRASELVGV